MDTETFKQWAIAAAKRAIKTGAQSIAALIGAEAVSIVALDWPQILGITATLMVLSLCTSIAGVPEVDNGTSPLRRS